MSWGISCASSKTNLGRREPCQWLKTSSSTVGAASIQFHRGRICLGREKINFSQVFAGQAVGIKEVHDDIWLVSFMDYDLGYFDLETRVLEPLENPFGPKVLPMS